MKLITFKNTLLAEYNNCVPTQNELIKARNKGKRQNRREALLSIKSTYHLELDRMQDKDGNTGDFLKHWDNLTNTVVILHIDLIKELQSNPNLELSVDTEVRHGNRTYTRHILQRA